MSEITTILKRMLSNLSSRYDRTKGGFFYDFFATLAIEIDKLKQSQNSILKNYFVDTAEGTYLTLKCAERGVNRKLATSATGYVIVKGVEGAEIIQGEVVASDLINFRFTESKTIPSGGTVKVAVECVSEGTIGNVPTGSITSFPKTLAGLYEVTNENPFTNGYDEETDEALRERYYTFVQTPSTSGNKHEYKNWALSVVGTGGAKVIPRWNGRNTVKVIIISANATGADEELIKNVSDYIEDVRPIGADVTVVSATEKQINVSLNIAVDIDNYNAEEVKEEVKKNVEAYIKSLAFNRTYVSYAKVGAVILDTNGVIDYSNLTVNDGDENVQIADDEVAVYGGVTFE